MSKKAIEILEKQLEEKERELDELKQEAEDAKYHDAWKWRHITKVTDEQNLGLPVPRLEMRFRKENEFSTIADYRLVTRHFLGHLEAIPFESTRMGDRGRALEDLYLPFRSGAHIIHDMKELNLPAYAVSDETGKHKLITADDR